jgi:Nuclear transport factor 2 (NTF2) domain
LSTRNPIVYIAFTTKTQPSYMALKERMGSHVMASRYGSFSFLLRRSCFLLPTARHDNHITCLDSYLASNSQKKNPHLTKPIDQEIHNKITSIGFEDCKVFIHSVDAQSSANGGIIIQVIGEMSNHNDPWRKFVQTFFLAEQPNGYFVLNDIFRFLKEETLEGDGADEDIEPNTVPEPVPVAQTVVSAPEPAYEAPSDPPVVENSIPTAAAVVADEAPTTDISEPHVTQTPTPALEEHIPPPLAAAPAAQPNGIHTPEPEKLALTSVEPSRVSTPAPRQSTPAPATTSLPAPAAAPAPVQPAATPAAAPAAPQAPRSWASLAASNPKKWGAAVNQESRGTTEILSNPVPATNGAPAQAVQSAAPNSSQHHQQHQHQQQRGGQHGGQGGGGGPRHDGSALAAAQSVSHAHCFVKVSFHHSYLFKLYSLSLFHTF